MNNLNEKLEKIYKSLRENTNTIHCITNPITINDMANVVLSLNQSPFMADNPKEVEAVTKNSSSLLINLGNLQDYRMKSIEIAINTANKYNIPVTLDLVGVSASKFRLDFALNLLDKFKIDLVKGNYSEIYSLFHKKISTKGIDSKDLDEKNILSLIKLLNKSYNSMILATGKNDLVIDKSSTYLLKNGDKRLKNITGSGCILGAILAACLSIEVSLQAVILAVSIENIASENIDKKLGLASFRINFLDNISLIDYDKIKKEIRYEKY